MIVWLNGTHGVGKTTTSALVQQLIPDSRVFDAEKVGETLMDVRPGLPPTDNFQHWPPWRLLVVETARRILDYTGGTLVMPMTVLVEEYWHEISAGLAFHGIDVSHFVLHADRRTLEHRIENDADLGPSDFRREYLDAYAAALQGWLRREAQVIDTSATTPSETAHLIVDILGRQSFSLSDSDRDDRARGASGRSGRAGVTGVSPAGFRVAPPTARMGTVERSSARRVRAVLFDLDGTLFDHEGAVLEALQLWLPTVGLDVSSAAAEQWFAAEEYHVAEWRAGRLSWAEQRRSRLRDVLPGARTWAPDKLDETFAGYLSTYEAAWRTFPEVLEVLEVLAARGLRMGILTNGAAAQQRAKVAALGLTDRFEFVLTSDDLGLFKPALESYRAACRRFRLEPAEVLHVGDLPDLDVKAPREAGLRALLIDRDGRHHERDALRSLLELPRRVSAGTT